MGFGKFTALELLNRRSQYAWK